MAQQQDIINAEIVTRHMHKLMLRYRVGHAFHTQTARDEEDARIQEMDELHTFFFNMLNQPPPPATASGTYYLSRPYRQSAWVIDDGNNPENWFGLRVDDGLPPNGFSMATRLEWNSVASAMAPICLLAPLNNASLGNLPSDRDWNAIAFLPGVQSWLKLTLNWDFETDVTTLPIWNFEIPALSSTYIQTNGGNNLAALLGGWPSMFHDVSDSEKFWRQVPCNIEDGVNAAPGVSAKQGALSLTVLLYVNTSSLPAETPQHEWPRFYLHTRSPFDATLTRDLRSFNMTVEVISDSLYGAMTNLIPVPTYP